MTAATLKALIADAERLLGNDDFDIKFWSIRGGGDMEPAEQSTALYPIDYTSAANHVVRAMRELKIPVDLVSNRRNRHVSVAEVQLDWNPQHPSTPHPHVPW